MNYPEKLHKENPTEIRFGLRLASCYQVSRRMTDCKKVISDVRKVVLRNAKKAQQKAIKTNVLKSYLEYFEIREPQWQAMGDLLSRPNTFQNYHCHA